MQNIQIKNKLADQIYRIFRLKHTTALNEYVLTETFRKKHIRSLNIHLLKQLPFIQTEHIHNGKMFYMVIELDDCCVQGTKCQNWSCELLHFVDPNDKFTIIYPNTVSWGNTTYQVSPLEIPRISLEKRVTNILNESKSIPKQMTLDEIRAMHNQKYPQFFSHLPTFRGITNRRRSSKFMVRYNASCNNDFDRVISFNQLIPDQLDKYYVSISISPQWTDKRLVADLVQLVGQKACVHIIDIYIKNVYRLGYFTTKNKFIVEEILQGNITCYGRIIYASLVKRNGIHDQGEYRIKMQNLPCTLNVKKFTEWIHRITHLDTWNKRYLIHDVVVTSPEVIPGSFECIMVFKDNITSQKVIHRMQNTLFRGFPLHFKHWNHPCNPNNQSTEQKYDKKKLNSRANATQSKLSDLLNTMNSQTFLNILTETENVINNKMETQQEMEDTFNLILKFAIRNRQYINEYVNLCASLSERCVINNNQSITQLIVNETWLLFIKSGDNNFIGVMELIAQLYNVGLFKINLIQTGILGNIFCGEQKELSELISIEGLCHFFIKCGKLLDDEDSKSVDGNLQSLIRMKTNVNTQTISALIDNVIRLRSNKWMQTEESEQVYNAFEDKYRQIFLKQQSAKIEMNKLMEEYKWMKQSQVLKQKYTELEFNLEPTKTQMNVLTNKYQDLQIKYDKLEKTKCSNKRYVLWNVNDIVNWIVDLDKSKYSKYCTQLKENMMKEGINGNCLEKIDKNDLHRFGVTQFMDKCTIWNSIQELITHDQSSTKYIAWQH